MKKILIVEDESIVALDIKNNLVKLGYKVCAIASSSKKAIEKCKEHKPDLVMMDIRIKGEIDGIETAQIIKDNFSTPVVFLTAHADEETLERAKVTDPFGYVLKPFEATELRVALQLAFFKNDKLSNREKNTISTFSEDLPKIKNSDNLDSDKVESIIKKIKTNRLLSKLKPESLLSLIQSSVIKSSKSGELLVFEGDTRNYGFFVLSGRLSLFKSSFSGRELIVELLSPLDLFGLAIAIEDQPYTFSARAQLESEVLYVPRNSVIKLLQNEPELYREFLNIISARLNRSHNISRGLAHDKVEARIVLALLSILPKNIENEDSLIHITRKELAELSGTTVETAIRVTKSMEHNKLLDLSKNACVKIKNISEFKEYAQDLNI